MNEISKPNPSYFVRLWNGDISLVVTFWVFYVLVGFLIGFIAVLIEASLNLKGVYYIITFPWFIFSIVALWRSSKKYRGSVSWRNAAQIVVFVGVLAFILMVVDDFFIR